MRAHDEPVPSQRRPVPSPAREAAARPNGGLDGHRSLGPAAILHLQRTAGNASVAQLLEEDHDDDGPSPVTDVVGSGRGQPLDGETRSFMEARLGHDFGDVRVHTGSRAGESAKAVQANAYTVGRDVVFGSGQWSPGTDGGRRMLAHELTHVVQQAAGPVDGTPAPGGIRMSDPADRFEREAERVADQVMAAPPDAQREAAEDEEQPQLSAVQRQAEGPAADDEELPA